ncbi:MAG TPA: DUF4397 domain-containing protein [Mucilaginibacter sp.]|nr:DUF4397 domain-containing protein [Mucilaginibacter sp.]
MKLKSKYITFKTGCLILLGIAGFWLASTITSCGKNAATNSLGLNIKFQVLNLSPDVYPVDIYFDYLKENKNPFYYGVSQGYFPVPSLVLPYYIKSANRLIDTPLFFMHRVLQRNTSYSLYITGDVANNTLDTIFTVDTASLARIGFGKVRFVDASPSGKTGLDVYANGTRIFNKLAYPNYSDFIELPNGFYDFQINAPGSSTVLKTMQNVQIQDGRLYTMYSYGYTTRSDSAAFNAVIINNR